MRSSSSASSARCSSARVNTSLKAGRLVHVPSCPWPSKPSAPRSVSRSRTHTRCRTQRRGLGDDLDDHPNALGADAVFLGPLDDPLHVIPPLPAERTSCIGTVHIVGRMTRALLEQRRSRRYPAGEVHDTTERATNTE